jgi:quinohemoprotein ethanol dehydrogenase
LGYWLGGHAAQGEPVDERRLLHADAEPSNWMSTGRTYDEQRYSPLAKIDASNAKRLGLAWSSDLDSTRGEEATPIVVDGTLYISTAWSRVEALNAATGKLLWRYDPKVPGEWAVKACCDVVNRGVAVWKGRIYVGTVDGRLIALDAMTGKEVWSVNTIDRTKAYSITGAPRIIKGRVLIGNGGAEFGVRGYISAYDAATGALDWRFYTVPGDPALHDGAASDEVLANKAVPTWKGEWWKIGGGGTVWDGMAYDPTLDLLYFGTGNGSPWNAANRSPNGEDNLFLSSLIAVRPETGQYVWHYQETPGDAWDYPATAPIVLADLTIEGKLRKVLLHAPKNGFFYVIDRATGQLISAKPIVPQTWTSGVDPKTGRPIENSAARYYKTGKPFMGSPGPLGAHSWNPMAFDPQTGLVYIPTQETTFPYIADPKFKPESIGFNVGLDFAAAAMPDDPQVQKAALEGSKGYLLAWDPVAQKQVWRADHPGPANGGALATAGNLVIEGNYAGRIGAYRATDGALLWSDDTRVPVIAAPISYMVDGEQYIAVEAGKGGAYALSPGIISNKSGKRPDVNRLLVYKLGGTATLPANESPARAAVTALPSSKDRAAVDEGFHLYSRYCVTCHGDTGVSGSITPDLRYSPFLTDDGFFDIVLKGSLKDQGMVSFAPVLSRSQAAAIREYLIDRHNKIH